LVEKRSAARATTTTDEEESMLPSSEFTVAYDSDEYSSDDDDGEEEEDEIETLLDEAPMEPDATPSADETDEPPPATCTGARTLFCTTSTKSTRCRRTTARVMRRSRPWRFVCCETEADPPEVVVVVVVVVARTTMIRGRGGDAC
jgi:hypothetical protein